MTNEQREYFLSIYSDMHKDARGVRPRYDYSKLSDEELDKDIEFFQAEIEEEEKFRKMAQDNAVREFEELVAETISLGAADRATALRWISQSETFYHHQCVEQFVWKHGLLFTDYGKKLVEELNSVVAFTPIEIN